MLDNNYAAQKKVDEALHSVYREESIEPVQELLKNGDISAIFSDFFLPSRIMTAVDTVGKNNGTDIEPTLKEFLNYLKGNPNSGNFKYCSRLLAKHYDSIEEFKEIYGDTIEEFNKNNPNWRLDKVFYNGEMVPLR